MKSVVVLSGGQDSSTCLAKALMETEVLGTVFFDYGQQHKDAEYNAAVDMTMRLPGRLGKGTLPVPKVLKMPALSELGDSALVVAGAKVGEPHHRLSHLPASFVPGRNLLFLTAAAAFAMKVGASLIWTGVCETDFSGYPDCRRDTIDALCQAIRLGMDFPDLEIVTPLMYIDKADTFKMAADLNVLDIIVKHTHTGYTGARDHLYPWGWGPAEGVELDPASALRAKGYEEFLQRYCNA